MFYQSIWLPLVLIQEVFVHFTQDNCFVLICDHAQCYELLHIPHGYHQIVPTCRRTMKLWSGIDGSSICINLVTLG